MTSIISGLTSQAYQFEGREFRALLSESGNPLFVGKPACDILGYANSRDAIAKHVPEKHQITVAIRDGITRGNPNQVCLTLPGLLRLIFASKMPAAERFTDWVTEEVVPSIMKTGAYALANPKTLTQIERYRLRMRAAELRAEAQCLDARARGPRYAANLPPVADRPEGWLTVPEYVATLGLPPGMTDRVAKLMGHRIKKRAPAHGAEVVRVRGYSQPRQAFAGHILAEAWALVRGDLADLQEQLQTTLTFDAES